jgi:cytochrome P450
LITIHESLRIHTPPAVINRCYVGDYTLPSTILTIKKGDEIQPAAIIMVNTDEKIWPNPKEFDPMRFPR